jgi:hypothetical protein
MAETSLTPPRLGLGEVDDLHPPALLLGVAGVHAEQLGREEGGLVAAGAGADLEDDVALVVRVLRDQLEAEPLLDLADPLLEPVALLLGHQEELVVLGQAGEHLPGFVELLLDLAQLPEERDRRIDLREGLVDLRVRLVIAQHRRIGEPLGELLVGLLELCELLDHGRDLVCGIRGASGIGPGAAGRSALGRRLAVAALEALDAAGGVDQLLLAREERVAGAADLEADFVLRGVGLELVAAGADHGDQVEVGMDFFLHGRDPSSSSVSFSGFLGSKNPKA